MTCYHPRACLKTAGYGTACLFLLVPGLLVADDSLPGYREFAFSLPPSTERMLIVDADGDGRNDLMAFADNTISLYFHTAGGFDFTTPTAQLELPGKAVGWDISDNYSASGAYSLIALIDGNRVLRWQIQDQQFSDATPLLSELSGFLGQGVYRLNFSRDINADGLDDLIIPGAGQLALHIRNTDGSYQQPLAISSDMQLRTVLTPDNPRNLSVIGSDDRRQQPVDLTRDVGQTLRIPLMSLRDVNGDGRGDLISDTDERFDVFLANADGNSNYFSSAPSYSIDRTAIRERLGDFDVDQLDFANLTGVLALTHEEILQDMNGDGIDDMILREGGRVALHLGSSEGIGFDQADQILRSGGNVLSVFLHDEDGDEQPDLWLWRVEQVSLGDVFLWLAISGTINIEAFVYPNEGDTFARRPARRITVALRFPSAVRMLSSVQDIRDRASNTGVVVPTTRAALSTGPGNTPAMGTAMEDLLVLLGDQVNVFYRALTPAADADEDRFLASIDYERGRDNYEIDVRRIIDEFDIGVNRDLNSISDRQPDISLSLATEAQRGDIVATDLNNNGRDDIFVFLERSDTAVSGVLWLSGIE
ncbi:MAG: VCBS repeat-containing protein [Pseudohongiella sp.]|uniref:FG-GAP repeat domain-containing protein n=1 Tax=Pseudohongiella sp. TaxID=1979412 RepID=UPI0034A005C8